jgi:hypothetical protein
VRHACLSWTDGEGSGARSWREDWVPEGPAGAHWNWRRSKFWTGELRREKITEAGNPEQQVRHRAGRRQIHEQETVAAPSHGKSHRTAAATEDLWSTGPRKSPAPKKTSKKKQDWAEKQGNEKIPWLQTSGDWKRPSHRRMKAGLGRALGVAERGLSGERSPLPKIPVQGPRSKTKRLGGTPCAQQEHERKENPVGGRDQLHGSRPKL